MEVCSASRLPAGRVQEGDGAGEPDASGLADAPADALADGSVEAAAEALGATEGAALADGAADADGATLAATLADAEAEAGGIVGPYVQPAVDVELAQAVARRPIATMPVNEARVRVVRIAPSYRNLQLRDVRSGPSVR